MLPEAPLWLAPALYGAGTLGLFLLRVPWIRASMRVPIAVNRITLRDNLLVTGVLIGMVVLPVLAIFTDVLAAAARRTCGYDLLLGTLAYLAGLALLARTHRDLGRNWSPTLQIREGHVLVTHGLYARIRHPMYLAFLVHALGQAFVLPSWIAGPAYLVAFALLVALRLGPEERMLAERFGPAWDDYRRRTGRLLPRGR